MVMPSEARSASLTDVLACNRLTSERSWKT
jgi:hypothetical protein